MCGASLELFDAERITHECPAAAVIKGSTEDSLSNTGGRRATALIGRSGAAARIVRGADHRGVAAVDVTRNIAIIGQVCDSAFRAIAGTNHRIRIRRTTTLSRCTFATAGFGHRTPGSTTGNRPIRSAIIDDLQRTALVSIFLAKLNVCFCRTTACTGHAVATTGFKL